MKPRKKSNRNPAAEPTPSGLSEITTHLLVVSGKRPAILTSTIWALAHESPPVIPDRITAITTAVGREVICRKLFTPPAPDRPCVWDALRAELAAKKLPVAGRLVFGDTGNDIRIFTAPDASDRSRELDDLRLAAQYEEGADLILDTVRTLTEIDGTRLIACVAGGRKPLVALLAGALEFVGRAQDRLVHVLINEPFDNPTLRPPFYFKPLAAIEHRYFDVSAGAERAISSSAAQLELVDVPLVRLRRLFAGEPHLYRSRYSVLARAYSDRISSLTGPIELSFDDSRGVVGVNGQPLQLRGREHPFFAFLYDRWQRGEAPLASQKAVLEPLRRFLQPWQQQHPGYNLQRDGREWSRDVSDGDVAKALNSLRTRLRDAGLAISADRLFKPSGPVGIPLAAEISSAPLAKQ